MDISQNLENTNPMQKIRQKFGISNNPVIKNNKQYLQEIIDKMPEIMKI